MLVGGGRIIVVVQLVRACVLVMEDVDEMKLS